MENTDNAAPEGTTAPENDDSILGAVTTEKSSTQTQTATEDSKWNSELPENWLQSIPEEQRGGLEKFKDVTTLAKSYKNLESMLGKKGVMPINENSTEVEIAEYRKAMGIPENPEGYQIDDVKEKYGEYFDENAAKQFTELAHTLNIPPAAAQKLMEFDAQRTNAALEAQQHSIQQAREETISTLKQEFGNNFDTEIRKTRNFVANVGGEDMLNSDLANNADFIRFANKLANLSSEDKLVTPDGNPQLQSVQDEIDKYMNDHKSAYWDDSNVGHEAAKRRVSELFKLKHRGK